MSWRAETTRTSDLLARRVSGPLEYLQSGDGMSLIELTLVLGLLFVVLGMGVPLMMTTREDVTVRAAVRYVASQAMLARSQAVWSGAAVGVRFEPSRDGYRFTSYVDRDGDGIRRDDIASGIDQVLQPSQHLTDQFPSVGFALAANVPPVDGREPAGPDFDPIRLGRGDTLTYSPIGTATSGSVYIRGRSGRQYAIRVLGTTGRLRVLRFDAVAGVWEDR